MNKIIDRYFNLIDWIEKHPQSTLWIAVLLISFALSV